MANISIAGDTSGSVTLQAPAIAGGTVVTLPATTGTAALTSQVIGIGQTWQNVAASRVSGTTYTNSTGKPIVIVASIYGINATLTISIQGVTLGTVNGNYGGSITGVVPDGATYVYTGSWSYLAELR